MRLMRPKTPYAHRTYVCNKELQQNEKRGFSSVELVQAPPQEPPLSSFLLTVPMRSLCCSSSLFAHRWYHMLLPFCH